MQHDSGSAQACDMALSSSHRALAAGNQEKSVTATDTNPVQNERAFSAFSRPQKRWVVFLAGFAGWFSTLSSFIFFPAVTSLAAGLRTSVQNINTTITSYLLVAAFVPMLTGIYADRKGRRPAYVISLCVYVASNIGLALQSSFPSLFVLRMVQAAGASGLFSIAYGVVSDIASPSERGSFIGILAFGINTAPSFGPVVGAGLNGELGWRAIFWFLAICAGICLLMIVISLPETARLIVDDGTTPASGIAKVPLSSMRAHDTCGANASGPRDDLKPLALLRFYLEILKQPEKVIPIAVLSTLYMTYTCLQASLSTLFIEIYGLNDLQAGLIYLPYGVSMTCMSYITGKILDRDYRIAAQKHGFRTDKKLDQDMANFPIEKARLRSVFLFLPAACVGLVAYGWVLHFRQHIAIGLVLQFCLGVTIQPCNTVSNTILMDMDPRNASTAQAVCNLTRCLFAAGALAILAVAVKGIGAGGTFTIIAGIDTVCILVYYLQRTRGHKWRR